MTKDISVYLKSLG